MSTDVPSASRSLPDRPNLRHLRDQAKDLLKAGEAQSITDAQFRIARLYGFPSWPQLKAHVDSLQEFGQLKQAIDTNDLDRVIAMVSRNPGLHRAPLGYGKDGPLTWIAECRIPRERPGPARLAIAKWMIDNGSDIHQGGDGPLCRAALSGGRIAMMQLLIDHGADVNALWHGTFPIIFAPCETVDPTALKWLLDHGANPNTQPDTALDYVIGSYVRSPQLLSACIDVLLDAGAVTRYNHPAVLALLRGRLDQLAELLALDPALIHQRFPELDCGTSAGRMLTLKGATLLHVAAEYGLLDPARLLLDRGADVNAQANVDEQGIGGQTPLFHAATAMAELLVARAADISRRARVPGSYEMPDEVLDCTALEYIRRFPGGES